MFSFITKPSAIPTSLIVGVGVLLFTAGTLWFIFPLLSSLTLDEAARIETWELPPDHTEDVTLAASFEFASMYGIIAAVSDTGLQLTVTEGEETAAYDFTFLPETEILQLTFSDDNDTVGQYSPIAIADLKIGDRIAVYHKIDTHTEGNTPAIKIIKVQ